MKKDKIKIYNIIHRMELWRTSLDKLGGWEGYDEIAFQALQKLLKTFSLEAVIIL